MRHVDLKPCPFCGTAANEPVKEQRRLGSAARPMWEITCAWYCIAMRRGTRRQVIQDWNTRRTS